jgi:ATP-dependent Clp protease protease subunit
MRSDESDKKKEEEAAAKSEGLIQKLFKSRTVLVSGQVDQELAEKVMAQLFALDADNNEPIRVLVTSPGGHVDSGFAIYDTMKFLKSPVVTIGAGWVASIAVPIFFGGEKGKRYSLPNTRFLLHQPSGGAGGQAADIRIQAQEILKIRARVNQLIANETGQDIEKVAKDSDRDFWMNAEEAVAYGLVDKVISSRTEIEG